ncbi:MAG: hypothetical protein IH899_21430 [Planctomycetes bacterium]|nr:hypothetical protein [Planctomycetota bacterium]
MATLLMGYDIECAAIGEGLAQLGAEVEPYRLALLRVTTFWTFCASSRHLRSAAMESGACG